VALVLVTTLGATDASASGYTVSAPLVHGNLAVYPVRGAALPSGSVPLTLDAAMARGQARIHEVGGNRHAIDNLSDRHLFLQAGDLVRGGSQDQVASTSLLVPPGARGFPITLFCVERDRSLPLAGQGRDFAAAGLIPWHSAKLALLTDAQATPTAEVLRRIGVWLSVEALTSALSHKINATVRSPVSPSSLPRALEDGGVRYAYEPYVDALRELADSSSDVIGAAVAINGTVFGAEIYANSELFREMWPRLLRAFAIEAVALQGAQPAAPPAVGDVSAFLMDDASGHPKVIRSLLRQSSGDWVYKSYVAKGVEAATELETAVLKAVETNWSIVVPMVYLGATNPRRYQEAVLLQALTGMIADREAAIAQAKRAGLPVDPQQLLRDDALQLINARGSPYPDRGSPWPIILLAAAVFVLSTLRRPRSPMARRPAHVVAPAPPLLPVDARVENCRPRRSPDKWTMSDWMGAIPPADILAPHREKVAEPADGKAKAKSERKELDLVPA
jgi:hypothetical protein